MAGHGPRVRSMPHGCFPITLSEQNVHVLFEPADGVRGRIPDRTAKNRPIRSNPLLLLGGRLPPLVDQSLCLKKRMGFEQ